MVFNLLEKTVSNKRFYQSIHQEFTKILPKIKTKKGKQALERYVNALDSLSYRDELGLKLLYLFKKYQLNNYSILQKVSNIVKVLQSQNINKTSNLLKVFQEQNTMF